MGGKVAKTCCAISGREQEDTNHIVETPVHAKDGTRKEETLEWLNELVASLWPNINNAVQKIVHEEVTPQLQASLPGPLKGTYFKTFTLGTVTPKFGPIELVKRQHGLKLNLGLDYESDVDIEISAVLASIGIKSIRLRGQLVLRLEPLIHESPVVGGLTAFFNDPPDLGLDFTGIGNVADCPGIAGMIRNQISGAISKAMVLPNVIAVPLATPAQCVYLADLLKPAPLAVLRVTAVRAKDLMAKDWHIMGKASSDAYVRVCVASQSWNSSVQKGTCDPAWGAEDFHDFFVFDRDQTVWIDVYDDDYLTSSDFIGKPKWPIKASEASRYSGKPMPLIDPNDPEAKCGSLELKFDWLQLSAWDAQAGGCVVKVEVGKISFPPGFGQSAAMLVKLGSKERTSKMHRVNPPSPEAISVASALANVARKCKSKGMSDKEIVDITGLSKDELTAALADTPKKDQVDAAVVARQDIQMDVVFYFSVDPKNVEETELSITALDSKMKPYATLASTVGDVAAAADAGRQVRNLRLNEGEGAVQTQLRVCLYAVN